MCIDTAVNLNQQLCIQGYVCSRSSQDLITDGDNGWQTKKNYWEKK